MEDTETSWLPAFIGIWEVQNVIKEEESFRARVLHAFSSKQVICQIIVIPVFCLILKLFSSLCSRKARSTLWDYSTVVLKGDFKVILSLLSLKGGGLTVYGRGWTQALLASPFPVTFLLKLLSRHQDLSIPHHTHL